MRQSEEERRCPLCDGLLEACAGEGSFLCARCGSTSLFDGADLLAMHIPGYELRLEELRRRHAELLALIEGESGRGAARDMMTLRSLHEERQGVLSEYAFLGHFQSFVERWQER